MKGSRREKSLIRALLCLWAKGRRGAAIDIQEKKGHGSTRVTWILIGAGEREICGYSLFLTLQIWAVRLNGKISEMRAVSHAYGQRELTLVQYGTGNRGKMSCEQWVTHNSQVEQSKEAVSLVCCS